MGRRPSGHRREVVVEVLDGDATSVDADHLRRVYQRGRGNRADPIA
jgi:hypothetical protein